MPLYELTSDSLVRVPETSFSKEHVLERADLQRLLRAQIDVLDPNLLVLCEEFGNWDDSRRRIDLLAVDRDANLVVIELKRDDSAGHVELQALRYAAMVSNMTFDEAFNAHQAFLDAQGIEGDARERILEFLDWSEPTEDEFGQDVRIVLVSADFSKEVTSTALWLGTKHSVDIRCVRLRPHNLDGRVLLDVQQIIPLPEADEYQVQVAKKERLENEARKSTRDMTHYDVEVGGQRFDRCTKNRAVFRIVRYLCSAGVSPERIIELVPNPGKRLFRSADGTLDAEAFVEAMSRDPRSFDPRRWFCDDDELIHVEGRTWAMTSQWGMNTQDALESLGREFGERGVKWSVAR